MSQSGPREYAVTTAVFIAGLESIADLQKNLALF
jgi:hypothetical protein